MSVAVGFVGPPAGANLVGQWQGAINSWLCQTTAANGILFGVLGSGNGAMVKQGGSIAAGVLSNFVATADASNVAIYQNGVPQTVSNVWVQNTFTTTQDSTSPVCLLSDEIGERFTGSLHWLYVWGRKLAEEEARLFAWNPNRLVLARASRRRSLPASSSTLALTPDVAALALTGYAPTVTQTTTLALTPSTAALALTGYAPAVTLTTNLTPDVGALTLTGYAPTVTQSSVLALTPDPAALTLTGHAPTVSQTANLSLTPGPAALTLTGYAPAIGQTTTLELTPGVSALTLTGYAPTVDQTAIVDSMSRPGADVLTTGWLASTGTDLFAMIDEASADDADYIYRDLAGTDPYIFDLYKAGAAYSLPAGTHTIRMRHSMSSSTGQVRMLLLDSSNGVVGTGAWQAVTTSWATSEFTITTSATATRGRIEAQA